MFKCTLTRNIRALITIDIILILAANLRHWSCVTRLLQKDCILKHLPSGRRFLTALFYIYFVDTCYNYLLTWIFQKCPTWFRYKRNLFFKVVAPHSDFSHANFNSIIVEFNYKYYSIIILNIANRIHSTLSGNLCDKLRDRSSNSDKSVAQSATELRLMNTAIWQLVSMKLWIL